jgi:hypothetical protein
MLILVPDLPNFKEGLELINSLVSTDTFIVAHFCETTRAITALTKGLNTVSEQTSLLVKCRELYPVQIRF